MIKINLKNLGIEHDNFTSETDIVKNNEVKKVDDKLKQLKKELKKTGLNAIFLFSNQKNSTCD